MERYDIAVIGTGPAGVSAAITATIRNKKVLLLGSKELSGKLMAAHQIRNYPGFPDVPGAELAKAFEKHLDSLGLSITEKRIGAVYSMGGYFALQAGNDMLEAGAVILATGVTQDKPLPGEEELLGHGVSYCATCDAALYRGKRAAVIGYSPREETEAAFLAEVCSEVLYFPVYKEGTRLPESVRVIPETVVGIERVNGESVVRTAENGYPADGVFVLREAVAPGQLVPGLEVEKNHVRVNRQMECSIPGVFACGDITGTPYQYVKAAGEGNVAALSAVRYLDRMKRENAE
ncbi:MAG: NAD(P)/FAD-dependent oxidoreductase [Clostridia bacterium]|nr:NAD(P)/FAD-dependent oxidoreductase [Clostridia bacterium]